MWSMLLKHFELMASWTQNTTASFELYLLNRWVFQNITRQYYRRWCNLSSTPIFLLHLATTDLQSLWRCPPKFYADFLTHVEDFNILLFSVSTQFCLGQEAYEKVRWKLDETAAQLSLYFYSPSNTQSRWVHIHGSKSEWTRVKIHACDLLLLDISILNVFKSK